MRNSSGRAPLGGSDTETSGAKVDGREIVNFQNSKKFKFGTWKIESF